MRTVSYQLAVATALGTALLLVYGAGALGIIGDGALSAWLFHRAAEQQADYRGV